MRVLQVNKLYYPHIGGVEQVTRALAEGLARFRNVDSMALVCNEGLRTVRQNVAGVSLTRVGSLGRVSSEPISPSFPFCLRRADADIYHFHSPFPLGELSGLTLPEKSRMVTWYHSDVVRQRWFLPVYRPLLARFLRRNRAILVSSPNLLESSSMLREVAGRCRVINFGIDAERFRLDRRTAARAEGLRQRYARGGGLVLCVGRLVYYKGIQVLLEAMGEIDAGLLILGRGPMARELEKHVINAGLTGRVSFVDWAEEEYIPAYYHACDLLVLPSTAHSEAFGLVLLEAQACRKPVISTELGTGTSYANLDGVTGLVVPPGSPRELAGAVKQLLGDASLREEMGSRGKERVERDFSLSVMIDNVMDVYREIMEAS